MSSLLQLLDRLSLAVKSSRTLVSLRFGADRCRDLPNPQPQSFRRMRSEVVERSNQNVRGSRTSAKLVAEGLGSEYRIQKYATSRLLLYMQWNDATK